MNTKLLSPTLLNFYKDIEETSKITNDTTHLDILKNYLILELPEFVKEYFKVDSNYKSIKLLCDTNTFNIFKNNRDSSKLLKKLNCTDKLCVKSTYLNDKHPNFFKLNYNINEGIIESSISYITIETIYDIFKKVNLICAYNAFGSYNNLKLVYNEFFIKEVDNARNIENIDYYLNIKDSIKCGYYANSRRISGFIKATSNILNCKSTLYTTVSLNKFFSNLFNLNCNYSTFIKEHSIIDYTITEDSKKKIYSATDIEQSILDKHLSVLTDYKKEIENISNIINTYLYSINTITNENIKEVSGYDICKYYNVLNYYNNNKIKVKINNVRTDILFTDNESDLQERNDTLHNSCMRYAGNTNTFMEFYALNKDVCKLIVLLKNDKVQARALLWKSITGKTLISRIYFINNDDRLQLVNYANLHQYINICRYPSNNNDGIFLNDFNNENKVKVTIKSNTQMPYLDTYHGIDLNTNYLLNADYENYNSFLSSRSTSGCCSIINKYNYYSLKDLLNINNTLASKSNYKYISYLKKIVTRNKLDAYFNQYVYSFKKGTVTADSAKQEDVISISFKTYNPKYKTTYCLYREFNCKVIKQETCLISINDNYYPINKKALNYYLKTNNVKAFTEYVATIRKVSSDFNNLPIYKDTIKIENDCILVNNEVIQSKKDLREAISDNKKQSFDLSIDAFEEFVNSTIRPFTNIPLNTAAA